MTNSYCVGRFKPHSRSAEVVEEIVLGGGCFWCIEGGISGLRGVESATPGYSGGHVSNPSYEQVCGKKTGHAEVVKVVFDPQKIDLRSILRVFFTLHDPTQVDRQGNDVGPQYRSCIFHSNSDQLEIILDEIKTIQSGLSSQIATTVEPANVFWPAEKYHHDYFERNPNQPYCSFIVAPKISKAVKTFAHLYE